MDPEPKVGETDPAAIEHKIEQTRSSLTEKLETLESEVLGTVQNVTSTVEGTIENVKDTVEETVQNVKRNFDLSYQVDRHPWGMMGLSFVGGFVSAALLQGARHRYRPSTPNYPGLDRSSALGFQSTPSSSSSSASTPQGGGQSVLSWLVRQFEPELENLKGMAIGMAIGMLRDAVKQAVPPSMTSHISEVFDSATHKMGGRPVDGPVLQTSHESGMR